MRIVTNIDADGEQFAVETASDGSVVLRDPMGERKPGPYLRVCRGRLRRQRERAGAFGRLVGVPAARGSETPGTAHGCSKDDGDPGQKHACETETEPLRRRKGWAKQCRSGPRGPRYSRRSRR